MAVCPFNKKLWFEKRACVAACPTGYSHDAITNRCYQACDDGFYMAFKADVNECTACPENCTLCTSEEVCTACVETEGMYFNKYLSSCTTSCDETLGFKLVDTTCQRCTSSCTTCHSSLKKYQGNCSPSCPAATILTEGTSICEDAFIAAISANTNEDGTIKTDTDLVVTLSVTKGDQTQATVSWVITPASAHTALLQGVTLTGWTLTIPIDNLKSLEKGTPFEATATTVYDTVQKTH